MWQPDNAWIFHMLPIWPSSYHACAKKNLAYFTHQHLRLCGDISVSTCGKPHKKYFYEQVIMKRLSTLELMLVLLWATKGFLHVELCERCYVQRGKAAARWGWCNPRWSLPPPSRGCWPQLEQTVCWTRLVPLDQSNHLKHPLTMREGWGGGCFGLSRADVCSTSFHPINSHYYMDLVYSCKDVFFSECNIYFP